MNLGGASLIQRSISNLDVPLNDQEASSSMSNLPPQRKWTKSHIFELIIGDAGDGVKTRSATQNECLYSKLSFSGRAKEKWRMHFLNADWVLAMQEKINQV